MTLQMHYQEKYEQGVEQGIKQGIEQGYNEGYKKRSISVAEKMIEADKFSLEEIALYSGLSIEEVHELENTMQRV